MVTFHMMLQGQQDIIAQRLFNSWHSSKYMQQYILFVILANDIELLFLLTKVTFEAT